MIAMRGWIENHIDVTLYVVSTTLGAAIAGFITVAYLLGVSA